MNIQSHLKLAVFISESSEINITGLRKLSFVFGNIFPDISFTFIRKPHVPNIMYDTVMRRIDKSMLSLDNQNNLNYFGLGIITHYLADFFCAAHNESFGKDTRQHYQYERLLEIHIDQSIDSTIGEFTFIASNDLILRIAEFHSEYMQERSSPIKDFRYIQKICMYCVLAYQHRSRIAQTDLTASGSIV